jgi:tetratricopeptide (TPR) repeat protein
MKNLAPLLVFGLILLLACPQAYGASRFEQLSEEGEAAYKAKDFPGAEKAFHLAIKEASEKLEKTDRRIATVVYNLALVLQAEGDYGESEKNMLKALELMIYYYGAEHQRVARLYMDLADLYLEQSGAEMKPELKKKAAENYQKGIEIFEKIYTQSTQESTTPGESSKDPTGKGSFRKSGPQDAASDLANALRILADSYAEDGLYKESEPLYKRSLELEEFALGSDTKELARHKARLAENFCIQAKYKDAEPLFKEALEIAEKENGEDSQETAQIVYNYGGMFYDTGNFGQAELMFKRALKTFAKAPEKDQIEMALKSITLADVLDMQGKAEESQAIYKQNMSVFENCEDKTILVRFLKQYQKHLLMQNHKEEANKIATRIKEIRAGQAKPETKPQTRSETKPLTKPLTKPEAKPEAKPETKLE